jgi:hypothetical protein
MISFSRIRMILGAGVLAVAGIAATAGTAHADNVLTVHYSVTGTAYIAKLGSTLNLGQGTLVANVDFTTGATTSTLEMPPATVTMEEFGFIPVTATAVINQLGPANSTVSGNSISATATVQMQFTHLSVFGVSIPVGSSCETSPFSVSLASGAGFTTNGGGPVSGTFTIPDFHGCGLTTLALNLLVPGAGNSFNLTLGPLQLGS